MDSLMELCSLFFISNSPNALRDETLNSSVSGQKTAKMISCPVVLSHDFIQAHECFFSQAESELQIAERYFKTSAM